MLLAVDDVYIHGRGKPPRLNGMDWNWIGWRYFFLSLFCFH